MIFSILLFLLSSAALNLHIYVLQLFLSKFSIHFHLSSRHKILDIEPSGLVSIKNTGNRFKCNLTTENEWDWAAIFSTKQA